MTSDRGRLACMLIILFILAVLLTSILNYVNIITALDMVGRPCLYFVSCRQLIYTNYCNEVIVPVVVCKMFANNTALYRLGVYSMNTHITDY